MVFQNEEFDHGHGFGHAKAFLGSPARTLYCSNSLRGFPIPLAMACFGLAERKVFKCIRDGLGYPSIKHDEIGIE